MPSAATVFMVGAVDPVEVAVGTTIMGSTKVGIGVRTIGLGVLVGVGVGIGARDVQAPMVKIATRRNALATKT